MKNWVVAFATEKFYLTNEDAEFYRNSLAKGQRFVVLKNGLILSDKCLYMANTDTFTETAKREQDKWQCTAGQWHSKEIDYCVCKGEYLPKPNGFVAIGDTKKLKELEG